MLDGILLYLGMILSLGYLGLRAIRALEIGRGRPGDLEVLAEEIEQLREQHQQLGNQITALRDGQDFARKLGGGLDPDTSPPTSRP